MKKTIAIAALAATAILSTATMASANVAVDNGVGFVGKGDIQASTALGWNNKAFDENFGSLKFTTGESTAERVNVDYPMVCMNLTTGDMSTVGHRLIVQPGTVSANIAATPVYNAGSGKQIIGFDLTSTPGAFKAVGNAVVRDTGCEGGALVMNSGTPTQPLTVTVTGTATSGLQVTGNKVPGPGTKTVDLPNTPVVVVPTV